MPDKKTGASELLLAGLISLIQTCRLLEINEIKTSQQRQEAIQDFRAAFSLFLSVFASLIQTAVGLIESKRKKLMQIARKRTNT